MLELLFLIQTAIGAGFMVLGLVFVLCSNGRIAECKHGMKLIAWGLAIEAITEMMCRCGIYK